MSQEDYHSSFLSVKLRKRANLKILCTTALTGNIDYNTEILTVFFINNLVTPLIL